MYSNVNRCILCTQDPFSHAGSHNISCNCKIIIIAIEYSYMYVA